MDHLLSSVHLLYMAGCLKAVDKTFASFSSPRGAAAGGFITEFDDVYSDIMDSKMLRGDQPDQPKDWDDRECIQDPGEVKLEGDNSVPKEISDPKE
ncbi:calreticulin-3-like isoform X1 [Oryza brachyantha]|uniref:calreticulin-3-like isoform X1 n=1 Tax=Oryza brachyantha TaxID=4533 RepID=UPI0007760930|nr:calreticulin-3-like isoform X1 [Oryza brachyantha]XP_040383062.1 calreticulin-3-like isoform X1 [Oryza brachyantha]